MDPCMERHSAAVIIPRVIVTDGHIGNGNIGVGQVEPSTDFGREHCKHSPDVNPPLEL